MRWDLLLKVFDKCLGLLFVVAFFLLLRDIGSLQKSIKIMAKRVNELNINLAVVIAQQKNQDFIITRHQREIDKNTDRLNNLKSE